MQRPVAVRLHRQLGARQPQRPQQVALLGKGLGVRRGVLHLAEQCSVWAALDADDNDASAGLQPDLSRAAGTGRGPCVLQDERRPQNGMPGERQLGAGREDPDLGVAARAFGSGG